MRCKVEHVGNGVADCVTRDGEPMRVAFASTPFSDLQQQLRAGDELSLLDIGDRVRGVVKPAFMILEPRFLVDVTTLCACCKPYGFNAANALLGKFDVRDNTAAIQLGNLADDLFDECVHSPVAQEQRKAQFMQVVQRSFHSSPLSYTALEGIDRDFFLKADQLHGYICDIMPRLPQGLVLESSFVCPEMGMQGRMDALAANHRAIVELKSGKCDEWRRGSKCKHEHELQMMLYREMLHYCTGMPRRDVQLLLFYCRYPLLERVEYTIRQVQDAMAVRNALVHQERLLRDGQGAALLGGMTEDDFNTNGATDKFYLNYCRPVINRVLGMLQGMDALTAAYFHAFTAFVEREQWMAKMAAYQGEALHGLHLVPQNDEAGAIVAFDATLSVPTTDHDFRVGDMVVLFESGTAAAVSYRHQFFGCYITYMDDLKLHLVLNHRQRDEQLFNLESEYSLMAGYMDAGFMAQYRGLAAFAQAPAERRMALLRGTADCSLIVGPPGTGKTSRKLREIVEQHLQRGETLLLMAYTNQAVDEICSMLDDGVYPGFVRVGNENVCAIPHRMRMMHNVLHLAGNRGEVRQLLEGMKVFVGTVSSVSACRELFMLKHFDLTVVDEASQVLEPQIVPLLCRVGRFVLIGDHKQLPAVVAQPQEQCQVSDPLLETIGLCRLSDSYFERLLRLDARSGGGRTTMLCHQGRMHEELMQFVNSHFYEGRLQTVPLERQHAVADEPRVVFMDVPYSGQQALKANVAEAAAVADVARHVVERSQSFNPAQTLGIIVPFRAQIAAIRSALVQAGVTYATAITIDTVERYQGSQRDVIIYSTTVTQPEQLDIISVLTEVDGGVTVDRKLNVALTRAREQMYMVGCRRVLMQSALYADWIESASKGEDF